METLADPFQDRPVKSVKAPPHKPLPPNKMYPDPSNITIMNKVIRQTNCS